MSTSGLIRHRRGFTVVELTLGLVVTAFVAGGVGTFLLAVSRCWHETADVQTGIVRASQFTSRLAHRIQDAKRIGFWRDGAALDAGFIFWQGDANSDGQMQTSEMHAVLFDAGTETINIFTLDPAAPDSTWITDDLKDPAAVIKFVTFAIPTPMIRGVAAATLAVKHDASEITAPVVSWDLMFRQSDGTVSRQTCVVSVRGPATPP